MSPKAILRRQCVRAMRQLIARFDYSESDFEIPVDGSDMDVLPGTPIYWWKSCYESGEFDCTTALDQYRSIVAEDKIDWAETMRQDSLRERYEMMRRHPERFRLAAVGGIK